MRAFLESRAMDTKIDESQAIYRETIVAMYRFWLIISENTSIYLKWKDQLLLQEITL